MSDIYATPEAELGQGNAGQRAGGNVDDAIAGNIEIRIFATLGEAWGQLKGFKLKCILAMVVMFLVVTVILAILFGIATTLFTLGANLGPSVFIIQIAIQLVFTAAMLPLMIGVMIMGLKHLTHNEVSVGEIFRHYGRTPAVVGAYVLQIILVTVGILLLVIPGIYLAIAYVYAIPLIVEKKMSVWQAMEASRKSVTRIWFRYFGFAILASIIISIGSMLFLIPLIWLMPWIVLANALIYLKLYGIEAETVNN